MGKKFSLANVRDHLVADRTILANERTMLSYLRLSLTLFVAGVSLIKFFENWILVVIGGLFIPLALLAGILGFRRYRRCNAFLLTLKEEENETISDASWGTSSKKEGSGEEVDPSGSP
ncbi:MAG: DUF202 domain-containing protein [Candidatus Euphemobacter frigidus]|nr:DUF202 domain-containing protein [Candidatus Euphemobacter frigidus]